MRNGSRAGGKKALRVTEPRLNSPDKIDRHKEKVEGSQQSKRHAMLRDSKSARPHQPVDFRSNFALIRTVRVIDSRPRRALESGRRAGQWHAGRRWRVSPGTLLALSRGEAVTHQVLNGPAKPREVCQTNPCPPIDLPPLGRPALARLGTTPKHPSTVVV